MCNSINSKYLLAYKFDYNAESVQLSSLLLLLPLYCPYCSVDVDETNFSILILQFLQEKEKATRKFIREWKVSSLAEVWLHLIMRKAKPCVTCFSLELYIALCIMLMKTFIADFIAAPSLSCIEKFIISIEEHLGWFLRRSWETQSTNLWKFWVIAITYDDVSSAQVIWN